MNLFVEYHFNYDYHAINLQKKYLMMVIVLVHLKINPKCDIFSFYIEGGEIDCWEIHQNFSKIFIDFFHRNIRSRRNWLITFIHTMQFMPCVIMLIRKKKFLWIVSHIPKFEDISSYHARDMMHLRISIVCDNIKMFEWIEFDKNETEYCLFLNRINKIWSDW